MFRGIMCRKKQRQVIVTINNHKRNLELSLSVGGKVSFTIHRIRQIEPHSSERAGFDIVPEKGEMLEWVGCRESAKGSY